MENLWLIKNFSGGLADEDERGIPGSFRYGEQLDYRGDPSYLTGVNAPTKNSGTVIPALPKWIEKYGTDIYVYAGDNHIYKKGSPWTDEHTNGQTGVGNGMAVMGSILYYASNAKLGSYNGAAWTDSAQNFANGTAGEWHPMKVFGGAGGLCIGDGRNIAVLDYDGVTWDNDVLILPLGERIKCLEIFGDYLAIGCWRGTNIYDNNEAHIYLWDGTSSTYNHKITFQESGIHALLNTPNGLMIIAGIKGNVYMYNGGGVSLLKQLPGITKNGTTYIEPYPGAITIYRGLPLIGVAGAGDDTAAYKGVFSWGSINKNYPETLNYEYLISTGTKTGTTCFIGTIKAVSDQELYIGWRDNTSYGVDLIHATNKVASCTYETLWFDGKIPFQEKDFKTFILTFNDLANGESITLKYRKDTETSWTTIGVVSNTGNPAENFYKFNYGIKARRVQLQVILAGTNNTLPKLRSVGVLWGTKMLD